MLLVPVAARPQSFEVASVKLTAPGSRGLTHISPPGDPRFTATNVTLEMLISMAFGVDESRIANKPGWLDSEYYDVVAKAEGDRALPYDQFKPVLQRLLEQRFKLAVHHEQKEMSGYALVVAKDGPKLKKSAGPSEKRYILPDRLLADGISLPTLAALLARPTHRPVVDETRLEGIYDIELKYAPEKPADSDLPSIFTALQEQLGLKLENRKVPVDTIVIDHVEKIPSEN